jgi:hypothetical protein
LQNRQLGSPEAIPSLKMSRSPLSPLSVPGYLQIRSEDDDDFVAADGSFPSSTGNPQAISTPIVTSVTQKDINVNRSKAEVGIIIGTLIAFGALLFLVFLIYRRRSDEDFNLLTWWQKRKNKDVPVAVNISDPMTTRAVISDDASTTQNAYNEKLNESQQNLVPPAAEAQSKPSILQKMQQILLAVLKPKAKGDKNTIDVEKGQSTASLVYIAAGGDDWSRRPTSPGGISVQTASSMAIHPALARIKSQKKTELRPGVSAFSWSTSAPTPLPPSHASMRQNPLPPLPSDRNSKRDTTLTAMTGDSEPARHMSVSSWVANMQTRQEKREQRQQSLAGDEEPAAALGLQVPAPVANPQARSITGHDERTIRTSAITDISNMKTPALHTATVAWHVQQNPEQVEVSTMSRSASRNREQGLTQTESCDNHGQHQYSQQDEYQQEAGYPEQEGQYPYEGDYQHEHEYSGEDQHPNYDGEGYQQDQQYPDQYEEQEQSYPQQYSQEYSRQEQDYSQGHQEDEQGYYTPPQIHINSPSEATAIPEEDWIPKITKYPSGTTTMSGFTSG